MLRDAFKDGFFCDASDAARRCAIRMLFDVAAKSDLHRRWRYADDAYVARRAAACARRAARRRRPACDLPSSFSASKDMPAENDPVARDAIAARCSDA